jgi:glycerophosphoryl diester phosphodiesterase
VVAHVGVEHFAGVERQPVDRDVVDAEPRRPHQDGRLAVGDVVSGRFEHGQRDLGRHVEIAEQRPRTRSAPERSEDDLELVELLAGIVRSRRRAAMSVLKVRGGNREGDAVHLGAGQHHGARLLAGRHREIHVLDLGDRTPNEEGIAVLAPLTQPPRRRIEPGQVGAGGDQRGLIHLATARSVSINLLERKNVGAKRPAGVDQDVRIAATVRGLSVLDVERGKPHHALPSVDSEGFGLSELGEPFLIATTPANPTPVYGHRFGSDYGPESSRAALQESLGRQVEGLECDIILSSDDEVFALHDPDLALCTNLDGWAREHRADEIEEGRIRDQKGEISDEHPLRLRSVLDLIPPALPLQLDVKAYADLDLVRRTTQRACEIGREHGTAERVELISFFTPGCLVAREHDVYTRLVLWADYAPEALVEWLLDRDIEGVSCEGFILSKGLVDPLQKAGLTISAGAVNSSGQLERLLPLRPDIIVSDRPSEIKEALHSEPDP